MNDRYNNILRHLGHKIEVAKYADGWEVAIECMDCYEVIVWEEYTHKED